MSASFAYEDPLVRQQHATLKTTQKAREVFREMGRGMWSSGKGFGKVGALFAGIECIIESVRSSPLFVYGVLTSKLSIEPKMTYTIRWHLVSWQVVSSLEIPDPKLRLAVVWHLQPFRQL